MLSWPLSPSATTTRLGTVTPGVQLRLETTGIGHSRGQMVRKLEPVVLVTVAFRTTAEMPVWGTPARPATCTVSVEPVPRGVAGTPPVPSLVSRIRLGTSEWNVPPATGLAELVAASRLVPWELTASTWNVPLP